MKGVAVCRGGPSSSHLFFADDSLIFCKASLEECDTLQHVLKIYEESSGQQLHKAKTSFFSFFFFNQNTTNDIRKEIKNRFGAQIIR